MKIIDKKENQIVFTMEIGDSLANSIKRYLNHIQVIAVDEVEISKNDSPLYDETIAHRIGLVPLKMGKGGGKSPSKIKLSVAEIGAVLSKEMKGAEIVHGEIPITFLNKDQELDLTATTILGKGIDHAKFSPGLMFYRNVSEMNVDKNIADKIKKVFPDLDLKEKGGKFIVRDDQKQEIMDVCEGISRQEGKRLDIDLKDDLVVTLESFGQMSFGEMLKNSIVELKKDLNSVTKKI